MTLLVQSVGPSVSLQDAGRAGGLGIGLSRGGAVDRHSYLEGCTLLDTPNGAAAIEMAGFGGTFVFEAPTWFALTGAIMRATLDGEALAWHSSCFAPAGSELSIGAVEAGVYGYLSVAGGFDAPLELGGRGFHQIAGLGRAIAAGDRLTALPSRAQPDVPMQIPRQVGSTSPIRVMPGPQTDMFPADQIEEFESAAFRRSPRANRQGVRLDHDGASISAGMQLTRVSDFISEGDVQMTGDGTPYVLLADCQTMGGYPRIGTVIPNDLPRIAQAMPGEELRFKMISVREAEALWQSDQEIVRSIRRTMTPRVRDPREMRDLLSYELVDKPPPSVAGQDD